MGRYRRIAHGTALAAAATLVGALPAAPPAAAAEYANPAPSVSTGGASLNVRDNASTGNPPVDRLPDGATVPAGCQLDGESITGDDGANSRWLHLGDGRFVSDAYVAWPDGDPDELDWCDQPADPAPEEPDAFVAWAAERAAASNAEYDVPVSVTVAQAINESGWGGSALTTQGNSYFGIKCFGTPGPLAAGCRPYATSECDETGCGPTTATFRVYRSAERSFVDHGRFLTVNPRYQPAFDHTGDPDRFAREIHQAGYATDPAYSDKLIDLMQAHDLYRFDD